MALQRRVRQRPDWLPCWIPFFNGRVLGLAKQTILTWVLAGLALVFFIMTILAATNRRPFSILFRSQSWSILVLRSLSEAAGVFLCPTIHSAFQVIQCLKISRPKGLSLPEFLAFQPSTEPLGLIVLALGRGVALREWPKNLRLIGLCRLFAVFIVPILGVLIMSQVDIVDTYHPVEETKSPANFGMEKFDLAVALELGVMQDKLNMDYAKFLLDPLHVVDGAGDAEQKSRHCVRGICITANRSCRRTVSLAQELQDIESSWRDISWYPSSEAVISLSQQVYVLDYADNVEIRNQSLNCHVFRSGPAAYQLCTEDVNDTVQASLTICPQDLIIADRCHLDHSWLSSKGWTMFDSRSHIHQTTALKASFVNATVVYERWLGIIRSLQPENQPVPTAISAAKLLEVLETFLDTAPHETQEQPTHIFGRLVVSDMVRLSKDVPRSLEMRVRVVNALQSLLAMALYYSQPGMLYNAVLPVSGNTTAAKTTRAFGQGSPNSFLAIAEFRYHISVGHATLIAYMALGGVTLAICFLALLTGTISELRHDAEPTLYPALDLFSQYKLQTDAGVAVLPKERMDPGWTVGKALFKHISGLRVVRQQRFLGERGDG